MSDYAVFAHPDFDVNEYANAILAGEAYPPQSTGKPKITSNQTKEDVSVVISKLNTGIDDVSKRIKTIVSTHHEALLQQSADFSELPSSLSTVRGSLSELESSLEKLRIKIKTPYQALQANVTKLQRLQETSDVLRRTSRFFVLARRLEVQMSEVEGSVQLGASSGDASPAGPPSAHEGTASTPSALEPESEKERAIAKAALSIAEIVALLDDSTNAPLGDDNEENGPNTNIRAAISLKSLNFVAKHLPFVEDARTKVTEEMESMVLTGLTTLNQSILASSLQTAYNLRVLPDLVQNLVTDLAQAVDERIKYAFDLSRISKEIIGKDPAPTSQGLLYKSRVRTEPTNITAPQWTAALWTRLESLIEEMAACCIKVYTLEKVLKLKRDAITQVVFLDEVMKVLENKPSTTFWASLSRSLEKNVKDASRGSTFLQQTLSSGYPKLLRLFHDFFAKIAVQTDTVYTQSYQNPETILVLRALSIFEVQYTTRSVNRLNEAIAQAVAGGARSPPGVTEGVNVGRTIANELDTARFDPLLVKAVAKGVASSLDMLISRVDALTVRDRAAVSLAGPTATPQQTVNGQLATFLYHAHSRIGKLADEYPTDVFAIIRPRATNLKQAFDKIVDPLLLTVRRELAAITARLHRVDFGKDVDPMSSMMGGGGGASLYMKELVDKLSFVKMEILSKFQVPEVSRVWVLDIVRYVIRTFVLHVSIAKPLSESGKLQLTSDMTELEFALSAFLVENPQSKRGGNLEVVGDDYKILRAMRPLLFLDNAQLASPKSTAGLPPLIVLHHILVRSDISLPHTLHGWQEAEYVRWVEEHTEEEAWSLVEGGLAHWEKVAEAEGKDIKGSTEYIQLARTVLGHAKGVKGGSS